MKAARLIIATALLAVSAVAFAQAYPDKSKPMRIIVPFGAGSGADLLARAYGRAITEQTGMTVIVDNKAGAEGVIGVEAAKYSAPDGYTVLHANSSTHVLNVHMLQKLPYDPVADFIPISGAASWSIVLNAGPSTKFQSLKEVIEAARANPGKFSYGSGTTSTRLAVEMLEYLGNIKMLSVPYKSMAQATGALAAGEIDFLVTDVSTALPHYSSGRLRPLAATGAQRLAALPNVPTMREQGIEKYDFTAWSAMFVPAHTPPAIVAKLSTIMRDASRSKYVADALVLNSADPLAADSAQMSALIRSEIDRWGNLLRDLKKSR